MAGKGHQGSTARRKLPGFLPGGFWICSLHPLQSEE